MTSTNIEKALDKIAKDHSAAHAAALKTEAEAESRAQGFQRQADELASDLAAIEQAWASGDDTRDASERAQIEVELTKVKHLTAGRTAAAAQARREAEKYHGDTALAEVVAQAVSESIDHAFPVYTAAFTSGQAAPQGDPSKPTVIVYQEKASERADDGLISGAVNISAQLPRWAGAALDEHAIQQAAAQHGNIVEVSWSATRATVRRGNEPLPLILEAATDDYQLDGATYDLFLALQSATGTRERGGKIELGSVVEQDGRRRIELELDTLFAMKADPSAQASASFNAAMGHPVHHEERYAQFTSEQQDDIRQELDELVGRTLPGLGAIATATPTFTDESYRLAGTGGGGVELMRTRLGVALTVVSRTE